MRFQPFIDLYKRDGSAKKLRATCTSVRIPNDDPMLKIGWSIISTEAKQTTISRIYAGSRPRRTAIINQARNVV